MFKRIVSGCLTAALCIGLSACGQQQTTESQIEPAQTQTQEEVSATEEVPIESTESAAGGAIRLTDQAGREVTLEKPAEKIVSCYYITTYAAMALGLGDALVGIESKADTRPIYGMAAPELLDLPSVGTLKAFDVEAAIALDPDLVIMPKKLIDQADALTEVGIPVLVVYPESQELLEEMLTLMGLATGKETEAEALVAYYSASLTELEELLVDVETPSVYMAGNGSYLSVAAKDMYQSHMVELAKGKNAAGSIEGDYWTDVSYEDILVMDPDVIIAPSNAEYSVEDILEDVQLQDVTVVKNGAVYQMPTGIEEWDSPIPSGILGTRWLASVLHEDVYPFEEFKQDAVEFYETFYGFTLDEELITK